MILAKLRCSVPKVEADLGKLGALATSAVVHCALVTLQVWVSAEIFRLLCDLNIFYIYQHLVLSWLLFSTFYVELCV